MQTLAMRFGVGRVGVTVVVLVMIAVGASVSLAAFLAGVFATAAALWVDGDLR